MAEHVQPGATALQKAAAQETDESPRNWAHATSRKGPDLVGRQSAEAGRREGRNVALPTVAVKIGWCPDLWCGRLACAGQARRPHHNFGEIRTPPRIGFIHVGIADMATTQSVGTRVPTQSVGTRQVSGPRIRETCGPFA